MKDKPHKDIVSFTFLGTTHHRSTYFSALTGSFDEIHKESLEPGSTVAARLFDGVGCSFNDPNHPMPGSYFYDPISDSKYLYSKQYNKVKQYASILPSKHKTIDKIAGIYGGYGIKSILTEAMLYLEYVIQNNDGVFPKKINLQGFSRGADTAVRLANEINTIYPDIEVNLFLVDQVAGPGRHNNPHSYIIPENVKHFESTIMLNEHNPSLEEHHKGRWVFTNPETNVSVHTHAGRHGSGLSKEYQTSDPRSNASYYLIEDAMLGFNINNGSLPDTSKITREFLRHRGSKQEFYSQALQKPKQRLSTSERFDYHCQMMERFNFLANRSEVNIYYKRKAYIDRAHYVSTPELFIDQAHRELFKTEYPLLFNWFFEGNSKNSAPEQIINQLNEVVKNPDNSINGRLDFFNALSKYFKFNLRDIAEKDLQPHGVPHDEQPKVGQPLISDELSYFAYHFQSLIDYYDTYCTWSDKTRMNTKQVSMLKQALNHASNKLPEEALMIFKECAQAIRDMPYNGFIQKKINQMVMMDPSLYVKHIVAEINPILQKNLPKEFTKIISSSMSHIHQELDKLEINDWEKYLKIKALLIQMHARLISASSNKEIKTPNQQNRSDAQASLFSKICELTKSGLAESDLVSQTIRSLNGYINRRKFIINIASFFGITSIEFKPRKLQIASDLKDELERLKVAGMGNNIQLLKKTLSKANKLLNEPSALFLNKSAMHQHQKELKSAFAVQKGRLNNITKTALDQVNHANALSGPTMHISRK